MTKKTIRVTRFSSIPVFLFAALSIAAIIVPDAVTGLPDFIDGYAPLAEYLNFSRFSLDVIKSDWPLAAFALGALLSVGVALSSIFGFAAQRRTGRMSLSTLSFLLFLGYGIYETATSGLPVLESAAAVDYGYYLVLGSSAAAAASAYLSKRK
ncbi:MAG: hypothetical protein LBQ40_07770 [Clostridiales bacterium]|jgi:hypothetical protein|nr:hypothetical protein [Clostridiales bacterium]